MAKLLKLRFLSFKRIFKALIQSCEDTAVTLFATIFARTGFHVLLFNAHSLPGQSKFLKTNALVRCYQKPFVTNDEDSITVKGSSRNLVSDLVSGRSHANLSVRWGGVMHDGSVPKLYSTLKSPRIFLSEGVREKSSITTACDELGMGARPQLFKRCNILKHHPPVKYITIWWIVHFILPTHTQ